MDMPGYVKNLNFRPSNLECTFCGFAPFSVQHIAYDALCNFCDAYVITKTHENANFNPGIDLFRDLHDTLAEGDFRKAIADIENVKKEDNPYLLYGLSNFYLVLSDMTYNDVDYGRSGFMEQNTDNRNNHPDRNRYNAMYLLSKSKEYFYRGIKLISDMPNANETMAYVKYMSYIKLGRLVDAGIALNALLRLNRTGLQNEYASMVYAVESKNNEAEPYIESFMAKNEMNGFYYGAKFIGRKNLAEGIKILERLTAYLRAPMYVSLLNKMRNFENAADL